MKNADNKELNISQKSLMIRLIILIFYIIILIFFYFLLIKIGTHPLISLLIIFFAFIIVLGPLISTKKSILYSRLFRKKGKKFNNSYGNHKKFYKTKISETSERKFKPVNLNFKYRKPIIRKCDKCGMIVPNFVNKCPKCRNIIKD